ncbi:hypothetical protein RJ639_009758 [Escallonia herrerae]|uniref:Auxin response factor n=1 Tax=Escallonia herrerae TaxID=1293975 RepID=A0AA89AS84_9ASTE|nr:hypothetical protein RJ639_009758 [Escallonia herrerae]
MICGLIDLNAANDDDGAAAAASFDSSPSSSSTCSDYGGSFTGSPVCLELWHACAGPSISLPKRGSAVVYLPQGHLERVADFPAVAYDLPPHVFCRVVDAEAGTDEVYAQVSLFPDSQQIEQKWREGDIEEDSEEEDTECAAKSATPHMFCKTLTASDTSTHGGFSVPRRAAEDCFPPLDYKQQRPSQELVAKDLHGTEWRFRHIYRGQPRRHLLTTGWSAFVNKKKLVSGDAVLFLRGGDGELRLGIRRAAEFKSDSISQAVCSQKSTDITAVVNAISMRSVFNLCYNPRANLSEFIIPFRKFSKSFAHSFSAGMRFKMRFETEDAAERRYTGLITGVSDMDPIRWRGSKWRCLMVRWDDVEGTRHNRVSPWDIEPSGSVSGASNFVGPGTKRTKIGSATKPDFPFPRDGMGVLDFGESLRFQKVLQGQEILGFSTPFGAVDAKNHQPPDIRGCFRGFNNSRVSARGNSVRSLIGNSDISFDGMGSCESFRFNEVLQGQEIFLNLPYGRDLARNQEQESSGPRILDRFRAPSSGTAWSSLMQGHATRIHPSAPIVQVSSPSSVLMFQQATAPTSSFPALCGVSSREKVQNNTQTSVDISENNLGIMSSSPCERIYPMENQQDTNSFDILKEQDQVGLPNLPLAVQPSSRRTQDMVSTCKSSCRLFGFQLIEGSIATPKENNLIQSESLFIPKASFLPRVEEQLLPKPPFVTKVMGSSCTKVSDLYSVKDMLLDIAL